MMFDQDPIYMEKYIVSMNLFLLKKCCTFRCDGGKTYTHLPY